MAQDNIICIRIEPSDAGNDQMESNKRIMIPARNLLRLVSQSQIHAGEMSPMDGRTFIMLERILGGQRGTLDNIVERGEKKAFYLPVFLESRKRGRPFVILPIRVVATDR